MSGRCRCAFGLRSAASRSFTATRWPMWRGAPERYMYARISGAKKPPAPATSGAANGIGTDRPHVALLSDCFSYATVSTRSWMPGRDELGRDDRGRPADRARGVHAHHRLADRAERVGEVELRHRDALEHVGRLADHDRVDVGPRHARVVERLDSRPRARGRPSTRPCARRGDASARHRRPQPDCRPSSSPSRTHDEVLLQARTAGRVRDAAARLAVRDASRDFADADRARPPSPGSPPARRPTG